MEEARFRTQSRALDEDVELTSAAYVPVSQSHAQLMLPTAQERAAAQLGDVESQDEEKYDAVDVAAAAGGGVRSRDIAHDDFLRDSTSGSSLSVPTSPRSRGDLQGPAAPFTPPMLRKLAQVDAGGREISMRRIEKIKKKAQEIRP